MRGRYESFFSLLTILTSFSSEGRVYPTLKIQIDTKWRHKYRNPEAQLINRKIAILKCSVEIICQRHRWDLVLGAAPRV